jgi:phospho-N-acetylmuramoyl-pentapeptide-transferase
VVALLIAAGTALAVSLLVSRALIDFMHRHSFGQPIREEGPKAHARKAGTPTMGGLAIVAGGLVGYLVSHVRAGVFFTRSGLLLMLAIAGAAAVGLVDDWIKVTSERNLGLTKTTKTVGLLAVATLFSVLLVEHTPVHLTLSFTRYSSPDITVSRWVWVLFAVVVIYATTNAVNLTDGADGLVAGSASYAFVTYIVIAFWAFRHPDVYGLPHALDIAVVAAAMLGACTGFLWWNAAPARIIMGDTGALAIGAAIAGLALTTATPLLLPVVGGLYVMVAMSVVIQVGCFRTTGRRVFRMAPIHHHFELGGWPETTVIIRFWILAGLCTGLALGFYYADFVRLGVID